MKQRRFGQKVQNWHRPRRRSELSNRFRRLRHQDPEYDLDSNQDFLSDLNEDSYSDQEWLDWNYYGEAEDCYRHRLQCDMHEVIHHRWLIPNAPTLDSNITNPIRSPQSHLSENIDERIADYVSLILTQTPPEYLRLYQSPLMDPPGSAKLQEIEALFSPLLAQRLCLFSPFWLRGPASWTGDSLKSLLDHLFGIYEPPGWLYATWRDESNLLCVKWFSWFILSSQGGSLNRASRSLPWHLSKATIAHLNDAPETASPQEACMLAAIKSFGGTQLEYDRIVAHAAYCLDPTEDGGDRCMSEFWEQTVRWLARHREMINDDQAELILDWAMHEYLESLLTPRKARDLGINLQEFHESGARWKEVFSWKRRSVPRTLSAALQYRRQITTAISKASANVPPWNPHGWNDEIEDSDVTWSFIELTSIIQLRLEGLALGHCVASYALRCSQGRSAIVSVRRNGARKITVEVDPKTRKIVQARGRGNRKMKQAEEHAVAQWYQRIVNQTNSTNEQAK